jgi:hypothetical protein
VIETGQDTERKRAEAKALMHSFCTAEDVTRWAASRRFLHTFSLGNQILLELQLEERLRGHDPVDCGFEHPFPIQAAWRWRQAGFHPQRKDLLPEPLRGALWVWAPQSKKKDQDGTWICETCRTRTSGPRCPQGHRRRAVFVLKPVFCRLQVADEEGELPPLPPQPEPLTGESHRELWAPLTKWGHNELGVISSASTPDRDPVLTGAGGYYDKRDRRIVVRVGASNEMVATLIHELAHACGVGYDTYDRHQAEAIVETAAYLACTSLGLDIGARSLAYVAGWAGAEGQEPWQVLQGHMRVIDELATRLELAASPVEQEVAA